MKYNYYPTDTNLEKFKFNCAWFTSEERFLTFCDQYYERFIFAPRKVVIASLWLAIGLGIMLGIIIGRFGI